MANNRFTGDHSTLLINMDNVIYAKGGNHAGSTIKITFVNGEDMVLANTEADQFRAAWRRQEKEL